MLAVGGLAAATRGRGYSGRFRCRSLGLLAPDHKDVRLEVEARDAQLRLFALHENHFLRNVIGMPVLNFSQAWLPGNSIEKSLFLEKLNQDYHLYEREVKQPTRCCDTLRSFFEFLGRSCCNLASGDVKPSFFGAGFTIRSRNQDAGANSRRQGLLDGDAQRTLFKFN